MPDTLVCPVYVFQHNNSLDTEFPCNDVEKLSYELYASLDRGWTTTEIVLLNSAYIPPAHARYAYTIAHIIIITCINMHT